MNQSNKLGTVVAGHGEGSMDCVWAWYSLCSASVDVLTGCAYLLVLFCIEVLV
jgi:hypothetical protein